MKALMPKKAEVENLVVPVCISSSHIAFGSIRMEPVFMILGESTAIIASIAIQNKSSVQDVTYAELQPKLIVAGQVLEYKASKN
jgi:hypothetical protein